MIGGIIGLFEYDFKSNLYIIAFACILGGVLLELSDKNKKNKNKIVFKDSIIVGVFQILALVPGMSRSGTVITAMRFLGINRKLSITFSLLTGIPVLLAACFFGFYQAINIYNLNFSKLFFIITVSFLSAIIHKSNLA